MKLIIRQYLASLKERGELDAILPDLLSELGLNVYSRPGRGTRQDGVDVAAVGKLEGDDTDKVYLFSIKAGDLTRSGWDGNTPQALRPSLNEIRDTYIPNRLPVEHQDKEIVICICLGGEIREEVSQQIEGYIRQFDCGRSVTLQRWNGDKLADLIQSNFLREELLPEESRAQLRKALALLDEPEASYRYFAELIRGLGAVEGKEDKEQLTALRQMNICLWILRRFPSPGPLVLLVDETSLQAHLKGMGVRLAYRGRARPLAWWWYRQTAGPLGQVALIRPWLRQIAPRGPAGCPVLVQADRGSGGRPDWLATSEALGGVFLVRGQRTVRLQGAGQEREPLGRWSRNLAPAGRKRGGRPGWAVGRWQGRYAQPWLVLTNGPQAQATW